jgi:hypothetical protein
VRAFFGARGQLFWVLLPLGVTGLGVGEIGEVIEVPGFSKLKTLFACGVVTCTFLYRRFFGARGGSAAEVCRFGVRGLFGKSASKSSRSLFLVMGFDILLFFV